MSEIANLLAKHFIARRDVKAVQQPGGAYTPHEKRDRQGNVVERYPWSRADLEAHVAGDKTFGHYLLDVDSQTKLFAFDIDLEEFKADKPERRFYYPAAKGDEAWGGDLTEFSPREAWMDRRHPSRSWQKYQLKMVTHQLMRVIHEDLEIPCAAAYSGGKGVHVYAFTGKISATDAREGARIVMDTLGTWAPSRGDNFYQSKDRDSLTGYPNLSIEVFPKQDTLQDGGLGNLMRLPLGRNQKNPKDPTFFLDMTSPMADMVPLDPAYALGDGARRPWSR